MKGSYSSTYITNLLATLIWILIAILVFEKVCFEPNSYVMDTGVDGLKTYFNPLFYIDNDQGAQISGMNYPFGEHLVFGDAQPLITVIIKGLGSYFPFISEYSVGIFNSIMILGPLLCLLLSIRIAKHYLMPAPYALFIATLITILSPQIERIEAGHFGLTHTFFIPWVWWCMIQINSKNKQIPWSIILFSSILLFGFIHVYYLLIGSIFCFFYFGIPLLGFFRNNNFRINYQLRNWSVASFLPLIVFRLIMLWMDPVLDRPTNPYGFFAYRAYWEGIFLPHEGPTWNFLNQLIDIRKVNLESYAFVGTPAFLIFIFSVPRWFKRTALPKWPQKKSLYNMPSDLPLALSSSFCILLFSMALPFSLGLSSWVDFLGPIKQFRSLGRFSWVFYHVFTMYAAVLVYMYYRKLKIYRKRRLAFSLLGVFLLVWTYDAFNAGKFLREKYSTSQKNIFIENRIQYSNWMQELNVNANDFQAVLPLPFFHFGSEKFAPRSLDYWSYRESIVYAYQTKIPLATALIARTSLSQSLLLVQQLSSHHIKKEIIDILPNRKPFILLVNTEGKLNDRETYLIEHADFLGEKLNIALYSMGIETWHHSDSLLDKMYVPNEIENGLMASPEQAWYFFDGFDQISENRFDFGKEVYFKRRGKERLSSINIPKEIDSIHVSFWVKADQRRDAFPQFSIKLLDENENQLSNHRLNPKYSYDVYKDWVRVSHTLETLKHGATLEIYSEGVFTSVESLLVRDASSEVFIKENHEFIMFNNFYFDKK